MEVFFDKEQTLEQWERFYEKYQGKEDDDAILFEEYAPTDLESEGSCESEGSIALSEEEEGSKFDPNKTHSLSPHSTYSDTDLSEANRSLNSTSEFHDKLEINIKRLSPKEIHNKQVSKSQKLEVSSDSSNTRDCLSQPISSEIKIYQDRVNKISTPSQNSSFQIVSRSQPVFSTLDPLQVPPEVERVIMVKYSEFVNTDSIHILRVLLVARFQRARMKLSIFTPYIEKSISTPPRHLNAKSPRKLRSVLITSPQSVSSFKLLPTGKFSNSILVDSFSKTPNKACPIEKSNSPSKHPIKLLPTGPPSHSTDGNHLVKVPRLSNGLRTESVTKNSINLLPTTPQHNFISKNHPPTPEREASNCTNVLSAVTLHESSSTNRPESRKYLSKSRFTNLHSNLGPSFSTPIKRKSNIFLNKYDCKKSRLEGESEYL